MLAVVALNIIKHTHQLKNKRQELLNRGNEHKQIKQNTTHICHIEAYAQLHLNKRYFRNMKPTYGSHIDDIGQHTHKMLSKRLRNDPPARINLRLC